MDSWPHLGLVVDFDTRAWYGFACLREAAQRNCRCNVQELLSQRKSWPEILGFPVGGSGTLQAICSSK